jgi:Zn-dependent protease
MGNIDIVYIAQTFLCLLVVITFHEAAHAYVAWKCGDDTAKQLGRISLNPVVHMELIGTVVLPLLAMGLSASGSGLGGFILGWGKPVPVNPAHLNHRLRDGMWVALAGPAMNLVLAVFVLALAKIVLLAGFPQGTKALLQLAYVSLILGFFNLIPVPPLDGSHVLRYLFRIPDEIYYKVVPYGFIIVIVLLNFTPIRTVLGAVTGGTFALVARSVGLPY